ncbi:MULTISPECIES: hypothetical protein [Bacillus]|uniref:hypothetical protein n=2 Tax=Bacillaceae TaxID=186817 RepID=UPI0008FE8603|nr:MULTISPECIES: hypothetical protein [Bacillus]UBR29947.1 hypothetical protein LCG60_25690 [Bacillus sp. SD-4]AXO96226.1 hypothetical protein DY471_28185 [Bacillus anthracis]MBE3645721.1 hypothetical protein [Bacillus anthracis]MDA1741830.1 hypothetical protein [Bacillus cereus]MDA1758227.1 hypothetical protein [Bacillus cereus]
MKKFLMSFSILLIATLLFGCSNETFDKAEEQGKLALANKEYTNANASFEIALKEKKDEEVQTLQKQASKMEKALIAKEKLDIDNAIKLFDQVSTMKDGLETVKNEAKKEKETLTQYKDKRENYNKELQTAQDLLSEKKFDESKVILTKVQQETTSDKMFTEQNQKVTEQLEKLEKEKNAAVEEEKRQEEQKKAAEQKKKQQAKEQQKQTAQSSKQKLSPTDAENKVRKTLNITNNSKVYCEYEGVEGEEYLIHVYQIVSDEEGGHTATYGWFNVNSNTGEVRKM